MIQSDKQAHWETIISDQEKSGLSAPRYCRENNLQLSHYYYYRSKLRSHRQKCAAKPLFQEVRLTPHQSTNNGYYQLILSNEMKLCIPMTFDANTLKSLLEVLQPCL